MLWMTRGESPLSAASLATLASSGIVHERVDGDELRRRYPQINVVDDGWAIFEPDSGVADGAARGAGGRCRRDPRRRRSRDDRHRAAGRSRTADGVAHERRRVDQGRDIRARVRTVAPIVVAPTALGDRLFPTRQEVFFFGVPPGDFRFAPPALPTWIDFGDEFYGMPDLEHRGFKAAFDGHGPLFDPDTGDRVVSADGLARVRQFIAERFPGLADAPLVESRVCQYENTSNGDFVIDRHPGFDNVWLAGGGSGHGFKHGPAVGAYVVEQMLDGGPAEPRFSLASKERVQRRMVH